MILSQKQIEEIAAAVTEDFNKFFFGTESEEVRMARATPIVPNQTPLFRFFDYTPAALTYQAK